MEDIMEDDTPELNKEGYMAPEGVSGPDSAVIAEQIRQKVGDVKKPLTFKQAFAANRKAGKKVFEWRGKKYTTKLASEVQPAAAPAPAGGNAKKAAAAPAGGNAKKADAAAPQKAAKTLKTTVTPTKGTDANVGTFTGGKTGKERSFWGPVHNPKGMAKGGTVKKMAKGGSVCRGGGAAIRGTKFSGVK